MTIFLNWILEVVNDILIGRIVVDTREVFGQRFAGHGHAVAMQQARVQQPLHQRLQPADGNQFGHQVLAAGPHIRQHRDARADAREVIEFQFDPGLVCHRQQVQHRIGGAAHGNDDGDGILERRAGQDIRGLDVTANQFDDGGTRPPTIVVLLRRHRFLRRAVGQA